MKPTIVLVHGAFADSTSWDGVIEPLQAEGHRVVAFANPLRSVAADAALLSDLVRSIEGSVVLVGHSYGGALITNVAADAGDVVALVYAAGFALESGESCGDASSLAPGSTLAETLQPVPLANGTTDVYIAPDRYHQQFCADVPDDKAARMSVTQRPVTQEALFEPSGDTPLWKSVASWFLIPELDRNIPAAAHRMMAERAGAKDTVEVPGGSHAISVGHAAETAQIILAAARG